MPEVVREGVPRAGDVGGLIGEDERKKRRVREQDQEQDNEQEGVREGKDVRKGHRLSDGLSGIREDRMIWHRTIGNAEFGVRSAEFGVAGAGLGGRRAGSGCRLWPRGIGRPSHGVKVVGYREAFV